MVTPFRINRGFEKCLALYPKQNWNPIFERLSKLNYFNPKVREFSRIFLNGAVPVELDGAGRLNIPNNLITYAGLGKDIVLVSAINKIEIWDKEAYNKLFESFSPEDFSSIAAQVMGGGTVPEMDGNPLAGLI
jgi:MraZ protein